MIILEGIDNTGKTTMARTLQGYLKKYSYRAMGILPSTWKHPTDYLRHIHPHQIQDRFHMSEMAYSTGLHRDTDLTLDMCKAIDGVLRLMPTVTVVLFPEKITDDQDGVFTAAQLLEVNNAFLELIENNHIDHDFVHVGYPTKEFILAVLTEYKRRGEAFDHESFGEALHTSLWRILTGTSDFDQKTLLGLRNHVV